MASYKSPAVILKNLATAIPPVDNILQCCPGLSALTMFIIITADVASYRAVASYKSPAVIFNNLATAIPPVDNILQCSPGLSALTRFIIITADVSKLQELWLGTRALP